MKKSTRILPLFVLCMCLHQVHGQADGSLDASFTVGTGFNDWTRVIAVQSDSKVLVGGAFTSYNGQPSARLARLGVDGAYDPSFAIGTGFDQTVYCLAVQADGKVLVGGDFTDFNGVPQNRIARLNADGSLDTSFDTGTGFDASVRTIAVQADGKVLVGSISATTYNGQAVGKLVRLGPDGSLDASFPNATASDQRVVKVVVQADGKILVGRESTTEVMDDVVLRLLPDGTTDDSFALTGTGISSMSGNTLSVSNIVVQPDGRILVVGIFHFYNGTSRKGIARLEPDGSLDPTFIGPSNEPGLRCVALQADGKVLLGGWFYNYSGQTANHVVRLNPDGTVDPSFSSGAGLGTGHYTLAMALRTDGKVLIGGSFTTYNGTARNRIARLHNTVATAINDPEKWELRAYPNPANEAITLVDVPNGAAVTVLDATGKVVRSMVANTPRPVVATADLPNGFYVVRVMDNGTVTNGKFVVDR